MRQWLLISLVVVTACSGGAAQPLFQPQANGWTSTAVDTARSVAFTNSLAVSPDGAQVRIAYYDLRGRDLWLAEGGPAGGWNTFPLVTDFDSGRMNAIAWQADLQTFFYRGYAGLFVFEGALSRPDPTPGFGVFMDAVPNFIAYTGLHRVNRLQRTFQLRVAQKTGSTWTVDILAQDPVRPFLFVSMERDDQGLLHLAYRAPDGQLMHAVGLPGNWSMEPVLPGDPRTRNIGQTSIVWAGKTHILFTSGGRLWHAWKDGTWQMEEVAWGSAITHPNSAKMDRLGFLRVAAYRTTTRDLVLFTRGSSWQEELLDADGDTGKSADLAVDQQNCLHISYLRDDWHDDLLYTSTWQAGGCLDLSEVWVDDDWTGLPDGTILQPGRVVGVNAFARIQDGVDAVTDGGTVHVLQGTYDEVVHITRPMTLLAHSALLRPGPGTPALDMGRRVAVLVEANNVTVQGLEIDGSAGPVHMGIYARNATGFRAIQNRIHDIANDPNPPVQDVGGVGILVMGFGASVDGAEIAGNEIWNTGRMGIFVAEAEAGGYPFHATANHWIHDNLLQNTWLGPTNDWGAALQVHGAKDVRIEGNTILSSPNAGIYLYGPLASGNRISGNTVSGHAFGIVLWHDVAGVVSADPFVAPLVQGNSIQGNGTLGLWNVDADPAYLVPAEDNWWGDASGPADATGSVEVPPCTADPAQERNADGAGDAVSENVDYCPWRVSP